MLKLEIPIISSDVQDKIATLIKKSFRLRKESETIIEASKHSIELEIEQNTQSAISYMEDVYTSIVTVPITDITRPNIKGGNMRDNNDDKEESAIIVIPDYREGCVPLYSLHAACGYFEDGEVPEVEGWVDASGKGFTPDPKRYFAVHAKGDSMLPKIKDGDICVFEWYKAGSRSGEIVLTECSEKDLDYGGMYTIKKYQSEKLVTGNGWQHTKVELVPLNKDYRTIELDDETNCRTIGVFKCLI